MPDWLKALIAGFTARKLGGGCLSTILIFVVVYYALGHCGNPAHAHAKSGKSPTPVTAVAENNRQLQR